MENYIIKIKSDTNINLKYKDTSFSSSNNEFSIPYIEVNNICVQDEKTLLDCSIEKIRRSKNCLTITLSIIVLVCFFGISTVFYFALLSNKYCADLYVFCYFIVLYYSLCCFLTKNKDKL